MAQQHTPSAKSKHTSMMPVLTRPRALLATPDNRAHLDLLVPLARAAVVGPLPWVLLEEVKKLVVLPRITEMNQWTSKSTPRRS